MASALVIRPVEATDSAVWLRMRQTLWPDADNDHPGDIARYLAGESKEPLEVLLVCLGSGEAVGFVELSIRPYAPGCSTDRVAFVEGWFVDAPHRGKGIGAALMSAAEEWGRAKKCTELGSDTETYNEASISAHKALGFEEVERVVCFRKNL